MPSLITFLVFTGVGTAISLRPQDIVEIDGTTIVASGGQRWTVTLEEAERVRKAWKPDREPEQKTLF